MAHSWLEPFPVLMWTIIKEESLPQLDKERIKKVKIVQRNYCGFSTTFMQFIMKDKTQNYAVLSRDTELKVGDIVDIDSIVVKTLQSNGYQQDTVLRFDGEAV